jgi:hypothetical protein
MELGPRVESLSVTAGDDVDRRVLALASGALPHDQLDDPAVDQRIPPDTLFVLRVCRLCQVRALLGDVAGARALYGLLLPYAEATLTVAGIAGDQRCAAAHYLGLLAAILGDWPAAVRHFTTALRRNQEIGAVYHTARTQYAYANMLLARCAPGDWAEARTRLTAAVEAFQRLRAGDAVASSAVCETDGVDAAPPAGPAAERGAFIFRPDGDFWTLAYASRPFHVRDMRGLHYIATLLRQPHQELHALDLACAAVGETRVAPAEMVEQHLSTSRLDVFDPLLDRRAREDYKSRLLELRDELHTAEHDHDLGRSAALRRELEFIAGRLLAAGRSGRAARAMPSPAERARINVRNSITAALKSINHHHAALFRHLHNSLKTGTFCSYDPDRAVEWEL